MVDFNNHISDPAKVVYPQYTDGQVTAFGISKVSNALSIWNHKNVTGKGNSIMEEYLEGLIIVMTSVVGTFTVGEKVTGGTSGFDGVVTAETATSVTINTPFPDFVIGETLTGGTSGATGTISTIDTGSYIEWNAGESSVSLTSTNSGDISCRQSTRYLSYTPKRGHFLAATGVFDDCDTINFVLRDSTGGTVKKRTFTQSTWNRDRFDGSRNKTTNPSEKTLDCTKRYLVWIDLEWLSTGKVRFGFDFNGKSLVAHEENHAFIAKKYDDNTSDNGNRPYMRTASLPIRYETINDGINSFQRVGLFDDEDGVFLEAVSVAGTKTMKEFCHSIDSDGGSTPAGLQFAIGNGATERTGITVRTPIFALREKLIFNGLTNRRVAQLLKSTFRITANDCYIEIVHMGHPTDIAATWNDIGVDSGLEYSTDITAITGRNEHVIESDYINAAGGTKGSSAATSKIELNLHGYIANDLKGVNSQVFVAYVTPFTGVASGSAALTVSEFD